MTGSTPHLERETVDDLFRSTVETHPDRAFLTYDGEETTYANAAAAVDRRAALLADRGLGPGDRLGLLFPNDPEFVYLLLACTKRGVTAVPVNYRQERDVLAYLLNDARLSALAVDGDVAEQFDEVADDVDVGTVFGHDVPAAISRSIDVDLDGAVGSVPADSTEPVPVEPDDVAILNYTSGTTGPPKGVQNPHRAFVDSGRRLVETLGTGPDDCGLLVLPLFHANPITYGLMHMIAAGGSIAPVRTFSASGFWSTARAVDASFVTHVGSVLEILRRGAKEVDDTETPLQFALGGAAGFDDQAAFEDRFDIQLIRLYGLSEVGAGLITVCEYDRDADHHPAHQGSVSDAPFDVRILDAERAAWADSGERGEILVRPDRPATMFAGYLNKPEETVADWQDLWMHTGDLGYVDEDENLHFVGRMKTSIRTYGENVSPWEVESPLVDWDGVEEVAAVGVPDEIAGEEIMLYAVPGADDLDPETVYDHCGSVLPDHLVPRYVRLVDSIPKTSTQKIERVSLRERGVDEAWDSERNG
jgi:carnitine-CoA ligase